MVRKSIFMLYFFFIISCTITGPEGSEEFDSSYNVRVINETSDTIKVAIGPKDFGFIAPADTTEYFPVNIVILKLFSNK